MELGVPFATQELSFFPPEIKENQVYVIPARELAQRAPAYPVVHRALVKAWTEFGLQDILITSSNNFLVRSAPEQVSEQRKVWEPTGRTFVSGLHQKLERSQVSGSDAHKEGPTPAPTSSHEMPQNSMDGSLQQASIEAQQVTEVSPVMNSPLRVPSVHSSDTFCRVTEDPAHQAGDLPGFIDDLSLAPSEEPPKYPVEGLLQQSGVEVSVETVGSHPPW
ncbi:hypothetical protein K2173_026765 [Erythroxylum novogranatense]|uniref:Uncharacterized protein n=1 Tax=Erythroxylum novogranatense TaxID=1862640 RepID=A0AAV8U0Y5_9ROSI|nr:hypothetical protein K2173_026765 [Erythroxylum novogranatense]